jgi:hypothetical protein
MTDAISRLQAIFRENAVHNLRGLSTLSAKSRNRLDSSVYAWFYSFREAHTNTLAQSEGLNLCFGLKTNIDAQIFGDPLETVVKKLSFFSETGVLLTPKFRHPGCRGKLVPDSWYYLALGYMPLLEAGIISILPKGITYLDDVGAVQGDNFVILRGAGRKVEKTWFLFEEEIPSLKVVDLSEKALRTQMLEAHPGYGTLAKPSAYIYLPHLSNMSLDLLVSLRRHHGDLFLDYNRAINKFLISSSKAKTAQHLADAMEETDAQVRKLQSELQKIASAQAIQRAGVILKITTAVLCAFGSTAVSKIIAGLLGGNLVSDGVRYLQLHVDKKHILKDNPFYFPWLVHAQSQALAAHPRRHTLRHV